MTVTRCHSAAGACLLSRPPRPHRKVTDTRRAGKAPRGSRAGAAPPWGGPAGGGRGHVEASGVCCPRRVHVSTEIRAGPSAAAGVGRGRSLWGRPGHCGGPSSFPGPPSVTSTDVPRHCPASPGGRTAGVRPWGLRAGHPWSGPGRVWETVVLGAWGQVPAGMAASSPRGRGQLPLHASVSACWASGLFPVLSPLHTGCPGTVRPQLGTAGHVPASPPPSVHPALRSG